MTKKNLKINDKVIILGTGSKTLDNQKGEIIGCLKQPFFDLYVVYFEKIHLKGGVVYKSLILPEQFVKVVDSLN